MKSIIGFILTQETNTGVPNLVVAAYDSDKSIQEILGSTTEGKRSAGFAVGFLKQVGKRMGSVLTDHQGKFELTCEELKFEGNESRPDLFIIVFAPEDILDKKRPYPKSPEERILYISTVPREDAGAEEAYIIRLLQEQLDDFHISANAPNAQEKARADSLPLLNAIESSYIARDTLREKTGARIKQDCERAQSFLEIAKRTFAGFSAVPKSLRNNAQLLKDPDQLPIMQRRVLENGLKRFAKGYKPSLNLTLTQDELTALQKRDERGKTLGLDASNLAGKIVEKMGGVDLIRNREIKPPDLSEEELLRKYSAQNKDAGEPKNIP